MGDLAERIVEAAGAVVFDHDGIIPADQDASRRCARAAIAAAVREAGLDARGLMIAASALLLAPGVYCASDALGQPYAPVDCTAALLRALAGIADAG